MINLRGRVKFPTGGDEPMALSPRAVFTAGFGEIPEPTVQSGWEKMEVFCCAIILLFLRDEWKEKIEYATK